MFNNVSSDVDCSTQATTRDPPRADSEVLRDGSAPWLQMTEYHPDGFTRPRDDYDREYYREKDFTHRDPRDAVPREPVMAYREHEDFGREDPRDPRDHYREHEKDYARESLYYGREDTMHKYYGREPGREVQYREPEPDYGRIAYPPREYREEYPARDYYDERPASEDVFSRKIYVGNLRHQIDVGMLKAHFGNFGEIENAEVMSSKFTGVSRGFGFVVFRGTAAMERVLAREHIVDGLRLEVKRAFPKGDRPPSPARSAPVKVVEPPRYYPRNDQHSFYYSPAREPARDIPRDLPRDLPVPDRPRESRESRDERHYSGQSRAYPSKERARSSIWAECEEPGKLWVGTFQEKPDEDQVRAYFSKYGEVADMVILESRNFGFVVFRRPRDAEDAIGKHPEFGRKFEAKVALARGLPKETEAYMRSGRAKPYDY